MHHHFRQATTTQGLRNSYRSAATVAPDLRSSYYLCAYGVAPGDRADERFLNRTEGSYMYRVFAAMMVWGATAAHAQPAEWRAGRPSDSIEILRKVDQASKAVKVVRYTGRLEGKAAAESRTLLVQGTVLMSGWVPMTPRGGPAAPKRYRCDVTTTDPHSGKKRHIGIGCDGPSFYLIDHDAKKVYVGPTLDVLGSMSRPAVALWMREFVHPEPFGDEINGDAQMLTGSRKIGDEDCHEIRIIYKDAIGEAVWWFSKRDFLPRGVQRMMTTPRGERAIQQWQITNLEVDPKLAEEEFELVIPEGYEKVEVNAP